MTSNEATELTIAPPSTPPTGAAFGHGRDHAGHDHGGHLHAHDAASAQPTAFRPPFSLVRLSLGGRLLIAGGLTVVLWTAVHWASTPIGG